MEYKNLDCTNVDSKNWERKIFNDTNLIFKIFMAKIYIYYYKTFYVIY